MRVDHREPDYSAAPGRFLLEARGQVTPADALLFVIVIGLGLYVDQKIELTGQLVTNVAVWAVMLRFLHRARGSLRVIILGCLVWSTFGEIFASLVWGLYTYRLHNVPPFVPPGHVLMLLLALFLAERFPRSVSALAPAIAIGYAAYALATSQDTFSVLLTPLFVMGLLMARRRPIYAATFLLVIPLELYGTWMGNWRWHNSAPWLDVAMANPPLCIGAAYCVRDVLAAVTLVWVLHWKGRARAQRDGSQTPALSPGSSVV